MTIALDAALSGLRIAQQSLDAVSKNISNASTPGYTRKILPQENVIIAGRGVGVGALTLSRNVNYALIADLNRQISVTENYNVRLKYLDRIQAFHGSSDSGQSLSARVSGLANAFTKLSLAPNDQLLLSQAVSAATQTADKINNFATLINDMRNNTEGDISAAVADVNTSLEQIANLNTTITRLASFNQSTADLEDQRDIAIKNVAKYIDIKTFAHDKTIAVITKQGQTLADDSAHKLFFQRSSILPVSSYPGSLNGLTVESAGGADITQTELGGQLGALFDLRDGTLPQYTAQLDEFSQKLAERFQNEGLKLFTGADGNVPPNNPNVSPPLGYVGFSSLIEVNESIVADPTLLRDGTTGNTELSGSNEVIRRIAQFTFGPYQYQKAQGTADISAGALITALSLVTRNSVVGTANLAAYAPDLSTVPGLTLPGSFNLTIGGTGPLAITVLATDSAADIVTSINTAFGSTVSAINSAGKLTLYADNSDITIADNTIGAAGMAALGFSFGTTPSPQPGFRVQVGTGTPASISIAPGDTSVQLLAALNAVPGLTAALDGSGRLVLTPTNGGDIKITDGAGGPLAAMGMAISNVAPAPFLQSGLGPDGGLSTGLLANSTLQDYISSIITIQSEEYSVSKTSRDQENSFMQTLDARNENISGVNIDQEMSELIRIQSAYAAAAKMIGATQTLFDSLLNAFR
ncbi:MAG: flagellar hook-associated protein FlgK [Alphaproteobacteria bacterium]|nr:flagellar hook-associated protein FlgK [Alphaproteobacteria bacterium]